MIKWNSYPKHKPTKINTRYLVTYKLHGKTLGVEIRTWRGINYDKHSDVSYTMNGFCFWDTPASEYFPNDKNVVAWAEIPDPYEGD